MFDAKFYDTLSRLRLAMGHKSSLNMSGNRKSVQKGSSAEFSDFREYMPGDDIRRIDWNAYGRLDRLYIKEYMEEKEAVVSILIDTSTSMDYGEKNKKELAVKLAAAMAYLALVNMDRVIVYDMKQMNAPFTVTGGRKGYPKLLAWLETFRFEGCVDILESVKKLPAKGPGVCIIISDFWEETFLEEQEEEFTKILRYLDYRKQKTVALQVLAGEELSVELTGTLNLIDSENARQLRITMDAAAINAYEKELAAFMGRMKKSCAKTGGHYAACSTSADFNQLIFQDLRMIYDI